ncbi:MAG: tRNA (adenosine(37)-N6)-dimethylallyltransferase MiaA [Patescibacteria group bacterium]
MIRDKVLIICGPTATGKTALALKLAKKFDGELISADSRQIYKGGDALTGKERAKDIPIWLYDVIDVGKPFSAHDFKKLATRAIIDITRRGKLPIVVGGTGFYLKALTEPPATLSIPPNTTLRQHLVQLSQAELQARLKHLDSGRWERMNQSDRQNPRRLIRAIEVATRGKTARPRASHYDVLWIGLTTAPPVLREYIEIRVQARFHEAVEEVQDGMEGILGAPPLLAYTRGEISKEEALAIWTRKEYHYAKRQLTWFKKESSIHWFDITRPNYQKEIAIQVAAWYTKS